jgi:hypothetical protein
MSSWLSRWLNGVFSSGRSTRRNARPTGVRPTLEALEDRVVLSTTQMYLQALPPGQNVNSYAGVGLKENQVATLYAQVNGQADPNKADFKAQIQWGDGKSSAGQLVYVGNSSGYAEFLVKGSHVYQQANSNLNISVSVTGQGSALGGSASEQTAQAIVDVMPSGLPGKAPVTPTPTMAPSNVHMYLQTLGSGQYVNSYAGVGFQENVVGRLYSQLNGQADPSLADFHAQINWGDSSTWSAADLVYVGNSSGYAEFLVKGSHVYQQTENDVPIVVYANGPDGTSTSYQVALYTQLNGMADPTVKDFHVQINWGNSSTWSPGTLVFVGMNGNSAQFAIYGKPPATMQPGTDIPVVVYATGPDGTSTSYLTADANVSHS